VTDGAEGHWFEGIADHLGTSYLRYSFTMGTANEVDFLVDELGLKPGMRVLDVGCGPGRHAYALAARGIAVHGVDIAQTFIDLARDGAPEGATFERLDARALPFDGEFDAVISLCQGAFGLAGGAAAVGPDPDGAVRDTARLEYFRGHLAACVRAIDAGVPLFAYFAWSLMDNFEWAWGYEQRFGLVWVDFETQQRIPKDSAIFYAGVMRAGEVPGVG
jgi:SAM-dependent methyltransferase